MINYKINVVCLTLIIIGGCVCGYDTRSWMLIICLQACECHVFDVPSPEAHYKAVCRGLVEEAFAIDSLRDLQDTDGQNKKKQTVSMLSESQGTAIASEIVS